MPDEAREGAMCHSKHGYASKALAEQVIKRMRRRGLTGGKRKLNVYHCTYCEMWHIGSTIIPKRNRI